LAQGQLAGPTEGTLLEGKPVNRVKIGGEVARNALTVCAANVKTANDHDHGFETRQGSGAIHPPLDGSENWTEIAIETEMSTEEEMAATEMSSATLMMILAAGETMANAMSVLQPDANSGTKNIGKGSVVPESMSESRIGIRTAIVIANANAGSWMNVIQNRNGPMAAIGLGMVETRTETSAKIREFESRKRNPLGWTPTSPANQVSAFLVVKPKMGNWMAFKHGNWA
jgi:hypothetical protein